ncbi:TATA box-binding protein-associated factor RNA polymerase I subunit C-like isoform X2 [Dreissena polymorpha]|nr:TATA box-binding protein-associated factor RNA polymerase I subunit C-like isoform X2 [Dreissena polymorpha]
MGPILKQNKKLTSFMKMIKNTYANRKDVQAARRTGLRIFQVSMQGMIEDPSTVDLNVVYGYMPPWLEEAFTAYREVRDIQTVSICNSKYSGGCLTAIPLEGSQCLVSVEGKDWDQLSLLHINEGKSGLLHARPLWSAKLKSKIYSVGSETVQDAVYVSARTSKICSLYKAQGDSNQGVGLEKIYKIRLPDEEHVQSLTISPYIPGECLVSTDTGMVYEWTDRQLVPWSARQQPRFPVSDPWSWVQYGGHPRQALFCDQTALQMIDLRTQVAVDLFCLPDSSLHKRERLRACGRHPASSLYSILATDYSLMLMDQRFPRCPVLKWSHMLTTPPQYMQCLRPQTDHSVTRSTPPPDVHYIYLGSQFPPEVEGYGFTGSEPVCMVGQPHGPPSYRDLPLWPQYMAQCNNAEMLKGRLDVSMAGLTLHTHPGSHTVYQMDCFGEIFYQKFQMDSSTNKDVTFSAGLGSHDLFPDTMVTKHVQSWVHSWEQGVLKKEQTTVFRGKQHISMGLQYLRPAHNSCCVCTPGLYYILGLESELSTLGRCERCLASQLEAFQLTKSVYKNKIMESVSTAEPSKLTEVKHFPATTALTKLMLKHWDNDPDIDDIMMEWDKEVIEQRKRQKMPKTKELRMDFASVAQRLMGYQISGSQSSHQTSSQLEISGSEVGSLWSGGKHKRRKKNSVVTSSSHCGSQGSVRQGTTHGNVSGTSQDVFDFMDDASIVVPVISSQQSIEKSPAVKKTRRAQAMPAVTKKQNLSATNLSQTKDFFDTSSVTASSVQDDNEPGRANKVLNWLARRQALMPEPVEQELQTENRIETISQNSDSLFSSPLSAGSSHRKHSKRKKSDLEKTSKYNMSYLPESEILPQGNEMTFQTPVWQSAPDVDHGQTQETIGQCMNIIFAQPIATRGRLPYGKNTQKKRQFRKQVTDFF